MRIRPFLAATLVLFSGAAQAQTVEVGARIGLTASSMQWRSDCADQPMCTGVATSSGERYAVSPGALVRVRVRENLLVQGELSYVARGYTRTQPRLSLGYLEVPVLLRGELTGPNAMTAYVAGGPSLAVRVACRVSFMTDDGPYAGSCGETAPDGEDHAVERLDLGMVAAIGVSSARDGLGRLSAELRWTTGLSDVEPGDQDVRALNRTRAIYLDYSIPVSALPWMAPR